MAPSRLSWIALAIGLILSVHTLSVSSASTGSWGPWTGWSVCSKTCGHGTAYRIRTCHSRDRNGSPLCEGQSKQYKICISQHCSDKSHDYRWSECSKRNQISYGGRRYTWVPYINEAAPCELSCKSVGRSYYAMFNRSVADGVICNQDNTAVCMGGTCIESGCDGVLSSRAVLDRCGVCNGDGDTCDLIKGIFTRTHLTHRGYNIVTTIPAGARSINVTELQRSRNYLALSTPRGYFLNGQMRLRSTGTVQGAGTTFTYSRSAGKHCPGDCLTGPGPLNTSLRVELIYFGRNPGIMYEYTLPREVSRGRSQGRRGEPTSRRPAPREQAESRLGSPAGHVRATTARIRMVARPVHPTTYTTAQRDARRGSRDRGIGRTAAAQGYTRSESSRNHSRRRYRDESGKRKHSRKTTTLPNTTRPRTTTQRVSSKRRQYTKDGSGNVQYKHYYHTNEHDNLGDVPMVQASRADDRPNDESRSDNNIRLSQRPTYVSSDDAQRDRYAEFRSRTHYKPRSSSAYAIRSNDVIPAPTRTRLRPSAVSSPRRYDNRVDNRSSRRRSRLTGYRNDYILYRWKISGFTPCSETCGGGFQQTRVVCVKSDSQVEVIKENCDPALTPEVTTVACNTDPCKPSWTVSEWSACSVTCGRGLQKRSVECKQRISSRVTIAVSSSTCPRLRPQNRQYCQMESCFQWKVSDWGQCSTQCGFGQRMRTVTCEDPNGSQVTERLCRQPKPETEEICDKGSCAQGWFHSKWSQECSAECGRGFYTRQVYCSASDGSSLEEKKCGGPKSKPRDRKRCKAAKPCGGQWFAGTWSSCNATCGENAVRQRDVLCIKRHGKRVNQVVKEHNCDPDKKPLVEQSCGPLPACSPQWFVMNWSECSQTCGTGVRTREVKCVDSTFTPSADCDKDKKPSRRQSCNTQQCDVTGDQPIKSSGVTSSRQSSEKKSEPSSPGADNSSTSSSADQQELQRDDSAQTRKQKQRDGLRRSRDNRTTTAQASSGCQDRNDRRWCITARQARLCNYQVYRALCCRTCGQQPHHRNPH